MSRARTCESSAVCRPRIASRAGKPANTGRPVATWMRRLRPWTRPRADARRRSRSRSIRSQNSTFAATTSSAAADGVGARTSATKSAIVTSVSWPTAEITGTGTLAMARATDSSLNAHRSSSEPPPQDLDDVANGRAVQRGDNADLPRQRRQRTLAGGIEQSFLLQPLFELIERELTCAESMRLEVFTDELVLALRLVDRELSPRHHAQTVCRLELEIPKRRTEHEPA